MQCFPIFIFVGIVLVLVQTVSGSSENDNGENHQANRNRELFEAVKKKNVERVRLLVNDGADVNARDGTNYLNKTVLHTASGMGLLDVVDFLLSHSANVNDTDHQGDAPIHEAAMGGHLNVVEVLLDNGANVNVRNDYGFTPLHWTAVYGHKPVASKLLERGADIFAKARTAEDPVDREPYLTPLDIARRNHQPELAEFLERKETEYAA